MITIPAVDGFLDTSDVRVMLYQSGRQVHAPVTGIGLVKGPATATDNAICRFDGTTGKLIQNSLVTIGDTGNIAGVVNQTMSGGLTLTAGGVTLTTGGIAFSAGPITLSQAANSLIFDSASSFNFFLQTEDGGAVGPLMTFRHFTASPNVGDIPFSITMQSFNSVGAAINFGQYVTSQLNVTAGAEATQHQWLAYTAGVNGYVMKLDGASGLQAIGSNNNTDAAAGFVGEVISANVAPGSAVALTTSTAKNVTSISLTAGDWDVYGNVGFAPAATTSITVIAQSISQTTNTHDTNEGSYGARSFAAHVPGANNFLHVLTTTGLRIRLAATTTIYLVASATFTVSTLGAYGKIWARRAR
jgi:hypothetical protein